MEHAKALGIKFLFTATILLSLLAIFQSATLGQIIFISIILTVVSYVIGDLVLLPFFGMLPAAIVDFGMSFLTVWLLAGLFIGQTTELVLIALTVAYFFAFCEALFHGYMTERVLPKRDAQIIPFPGLRFQTEASEEIHPEQDDKKK